MLIFKGRIVQPRGSTRAVKALIGHIDIGVEMLNEAWSKHPLGPFLRPIALGRPISRPYNAREAAEILRSSQGFGLSGHADIPYDELMPHRARQKKIKSSWHCMRARSQGSR